MQLKISILLTGFAAYVAGQTPIGQICQDPNEMGSCFNVALPGKCFNLPDNPANGFSSFKPAAGHMCSMFDGLGCTGNNLTSGNTLNLNLLFCNGFCWDNDVSSIICN